MAEKGLERKDLEELFSAFEDRQDKKLMAFEKRQDEKLKVFQERQDERFIAFEKRQDEKTKSLEERIIHQFHVISEIGRAHV